MKAKDLLKIEFIGLKIEVMNSKNHSLNGLKGVVVDETKNTLIIETDNGLKSLLKSQIHFGFKINETKYIIDGKKICFRPEERIKKIKT